MTYLGAFEIFFILAQMVRHSVEAFYLLKNKAEDTPFRYAVGFGCLISALWFLTAFVTHTEHHPVSQG